MKRTDGRTTLTICMAALLGLFVTLAAAQGHYRRLVVFGDSLSDPGNAFVLLQEVEVPPYELIPDAPYAHSGLHFSNGATWVERLANALGVGSSAGPALRPSKKFSNYAVGGARARQEGAFDLRTQVNLFLADYHGHAPARALYVMFIGGNDLRDALQALATDPSGTTSTGILFAAITAMRHNLVTLAASGARVFLVPNAPNLALAPAMRLQGPAVQGIAQQLSVAFNTRLDATLSQLEARLPITIKRLDVFTLLNQVVADPAAFGLSEVEQPCITPGTLVGASCAQPRKYLFWDGVHPTRAGHAILAHEAHAVLAHP